MVIVEHTDCKHRVFAFTHTHVNVVRRTASSSQVLVPKMRACRSTLPARRCDRARTVHTACHGPTSAVDGMGRARL